MTQPTFHDTASYNVIYVFSVDVENHKGCLKIGKATVHTKKNADELPPNCDELNEASMQRIKSYTNTVGIEPQLLYTEVAVKKVQTENGEKIVGFQDKHVHPILMHSKIQKKTFHGTTADEWFEVDLKTVKNAIKAVKNDKPTLTPDEISFEAPIIHLRDEQRDAIDMTLARFKKKNEMLWNA